MSETLELSRIARDDHEPRAAATQTLELDLHGLEVLFAACRLDARACGAEAVVCLALDAPSAVAGYARGFDSFGAIDFDDRTTREQRSERALVDEEPLALGKKAAGFFGRRLGGFEQRELILDRTLDRGRVDEHH